MQVRDVMTWGAECIDPEASLAAVADRMRVLDVGALPVYEHGRLAGVVTDRDIVVRSVALGHSPQTDRVRDVMTPGVHYCFEDDEVASAVEIMKEKQIRRLPVLTRDKQLRGILSITDLASERQAAQLVARVLEGSTPTAAGA